jgi:hypothetical protein
MELMEQAKLLMEVANVRIIDGTPPAEEIALNNSD